MANLYVVRKAERKGLYLPMGGTKKNPSLMFVLNRKLERGELDELVRAQLAQKGITNESEVQTIVDQAEKEYEDRIKVEEAKREIARLMNIRRSGGKLMSTGFRKWRQAFYPALRSKK